MKKWFLLWTVFICLMLCSQVIAETMFINAKTSNRIHLRAAASQESQSMGLFYTGTEVQLDPFQSFNEWSKVSVGSLNGYVKSEYLQPDRTAVEWGVGYVT